MKLMKKTALRSTTFLSIVTIFAGTNAHAQEAAAEAADVAEEAIIVTGSRIVRPNLEANSPISVVTGDAVQARGDITLDTFLNTLPGVNPAGTTTSNNPPNGGQSNIDLRGLGPNRNLVLVDGRRPMVSQSDQTVDLNTIPQALIKRIDVITGGAGAAYGADAIAGVVNIMLKDDFEGIDLRAGYQNSIPRTDAREWFLSGTIGGNFNENRGNIVVSFERSKRQGLIKSQRDFASVATATTTFLPEGLYQPGGNAPTQAAVDAYFGQFGATPGSVQAGASKISFNTDGSLFAIGTFNNPADVVNFRYPIDGSVNTSLFPDTYSYNFDIVNILVLPLKRDSVFGKARYELTDNIEFFGQANYTNYKTTSALAPSPVSTVNLEYASGSDPLRANSPLLVEPGTLLSNGTISTGGSVAASLVVPVTNPFIPQALRDLLATRTGDNLNLVGSGATEPFTMRSRTLGIGLRQSVYTNKVYQFLGGLRGEFAPGWRYEASFSEGKTKIIEEQTGNVDTERLLNLLNAPDGGNSICAGGFNPFGRNPLSQACIDYLAVSSDLETVFKQRIAQAYITGQVAQLPAGPLSVVAGVEYRKFNYDFDPAVLGGPISGLNAQAPASGQNKFMDFFGELGVPLFKDASWARSLELTLGARYSKSKARDNLTGLSTPSRGDWAYKAELSYQPIDVLRLRAAYQRSVRAPNFDELFDASGDNPQYFDPCSTTSAARTSRSDASAVSALCLNGTGLSPADAANITVAPGYVQTPGTQISLEVAGNQNLKPEKADTFTAGLVLSNLSGGLSRLRLSLDYYNIKVSDVILEPDPNRIVANCYNYYGNNPTLSGTNTNCQYIARLGGDILGFGPDFGNGGYTGQNLGFIKTSGVDLQLGYDFDLPFLGEEAKLNFDLLMNYLIDYKTKEFADQPVIDLAGTVSVFGAPLGGSQPRLKGVLNTALALNENFSLTSRIRYIHKMKNRYNKIYPGETEFEGVPTVVYFDFGADFTFEEKFNFRIGLNNAFNKQPPEYAPNVQSGTDPSLYDVIGRRFYVQAGVKF